MQSSVKADHYAVLGVSRDASVKDINSAYKKLALKHHPDKAGTDDKAMTKFRKIQDAIEVLRDPVKRKKHDRDLSQKTKHWSVILEDDPDFGGPGYTGWTPYGGRKWDLNNAWDRYMSTYHNASHMDPGAVPQDAWAAAAEMEAKFKREEEEQKRAEEEAARREVEMELERKKRRRDGMKARLFRDDIENAIEDMKESLRQDVRKEIEAENAMKAGAVFVDSDADSSPDFSDEYSEEEYTESYDSSSGDDDDDDGGNSEGQATSSQDTDETASSTRETGNMAARYTCAASYTGTETESEDENSYDMAKLIPYFNYKLAHPSRQYSLKDLRAELEGMVLETFCGFVENLRLSFPHANPMIPGNDPEDCPHHGMWTREFLKKEY
ncbi:hypothetical protein PVAR5_1125 [Paecilomyces variotii No. 5]|uniref:J domain-containing protein n=1 Tax=Byssochlamys spectabilis (strain No. 5 / NBRC 109023) TaxID=1356009 RepID=V5FVA8_BYSSN|nr:hypothetical protein PVAR5_1125 [Paecilomyces variotii No. 5]